MKRFDPVEVAHYDHRIRRLVPGYDLLHLLSSAELLARLPEDAARVLVVGAGTELLALAGQRPGWCFTATDLSAPMLAVAQQRCLAAGIQERVQLHVGELDRLQGPAPHDAALLLLVAHFVPDDGRKQALLAQTAAQLRPGAPLLLADLRAGADALERRCHGEASRLLGLGEDEVAAMLQRLESSFYPVDAARREALLRATGFGPARLYFRAAGFEAVVSLRL